MSLSKHHKEAIQWTHGVITSYILCPESSLLSHLFNEHHLSEERHVNFQLKFASEHQVPCEKDIRYLSLKLKLAIQFSCRIEFAWEGFYSSIRYPVSLHITGQIAAASVAGWAFLLKEGVVKSSLLTLKLQAIYNQLCDWYPFGQGKS